MFLPGSITSSAAIMRQHSGQVISEEMSFSNWTRSTSKKSVSPVSATGSGSSMPSRHSDSDAPTVATRCTAPFVQESSLVRKKATHCTGEPALPPRLPHVWFHVDKSTAGLPLFSSALPQTLNLIFLSSSVTVTPPRLLISGPFLTLSPPPLPLLPLPQLLSPLLEPPSLRLPEALFFPSLPFLAPFHRRHPHHHRRPRLFVLPPVLYMDGGLQLSSMFQSLPHSLSHLLRL